MALEHLLFFGSIEALVTVGVVAALARTQPELLAARPAAKPLRWLWAGLALLLLLTPLGALAPGTAWGEWSGEQLKTALGYAPGGLAHLGDTWKRRHARLLDPGRRQQLRRVPRWPAPYGVALVAGLAWGGGGLPLAAPRRGRRGEHCARARPRRPRARGRSLARKTADSVARSVADVLENEEIAARRGLLQRLDPRVKLATLVLFAVVASLVHSIWTLLGLVVVTVLLAAASRVPLLSFIRKVWLSAALLAFLVAVPSALSWFTPGTVAFQMGPSRSPSRGSSAWPPW